MCFLKLIFRQGREALQQKRAEVVDPDKVHDLFVSKHGICDRTTRAEQRDQ